MNSINKWLIPFCVVLLTACGSDSNKTETTRVPTIPEGFGDNNSLTSIRGTWHQDCAPTSGNLAKRQQVEFGEKSIRLTIWDYTDSSCSASNLRTRNTFIGEYQLEAETTTPGRNRFSVDPFKVIYTQSLSTAFSKGEVEARNKNRTCGKADWVSGQEVDVSDWKSCFPLFDIPAREHFRFVRIEDLASDSPKLFLDNQLEGYQANGYPNELDPSFFDPGAL